MTSLLPFHLLESHNYYPEAFCLELETISLPSANHKQFELYVNLSFNQEWVSLLGGRVKFALKGGQLNINLYHCQIDKLIYPAHSLLLLGKNPVHQGEKLTLMTVETTEIKPHHSSGLYRWDLATIREHLFLQGGLSKLTILEAEIIEKDYAIKAEFQPKLADIYITDAEGLWKHDLSPNKHSILTVKLGLFLLNHRFKPAMSWLLLRGNESNQSTMNAELSQGIEQVESDEDWDNQVKLKQEIDEIAHSKSDNLADLAKLAKLDLSQDFAGANLLATNLSGIDFSGANLERVNLRGSDLTDADLSESNLRGAKLGGADLSGGYLENADLREADLHRASLAVVNLIAADLRGANLQSTNLTNTNFTTAHVEGAKFGKNVGLTEETKEHLLERGAIFIEE
jgi:Pentapeptide repeats (8 copies)